MRATPSHDFVGLQVRDLVASARFYTERLGLRRAPESPPGAVVFATSPIPFALREPVVDFDATGPLGRGVALWLRAEESRGLHDALAGGGVHIVQPPSDAPFGRTFAFADPDGYVLTVHDGG